MEKSESLFNVLIAFIVIFSVSAQEYHGNIPNSSIGAKKASKQANQPYTPDKGMSSENEDNDLGKNLIFKRPISDNFQNFLNKYIKHQKQPKPSNETSVPLETMAESNLKYNGVLIGENVDQHKRPQTQKINSYHQTSDKNQEFFQNEDDSSEEIKFNQPNFNENFDLKQKKLPFKTLSEYLSKNTKLDFVNKNSVPHKASNAAGVHPFTYLLFVSKYYKGPSKDKKYFHKPSNKEPSGGKYNAALRKAPFFPVNGFSNNNKVLTRRKDFTPFGKILNLKRPLGGKQNTMIGVPSFISRFFASNRYQPASYEVPSILDKEFTFQDSDIDFTRPIAGKYNKVNEEHFLPFANSLPYLYYPSYSGVQSILGKDEDFASPEDSNIAYALPNRPTAAKHNEVNGESLLPSDYSLPYHYHPSSESEENEDFMPFEDYTTYEDNNMSYEDNTSYEDMDVGFAPPKGPTESTYQDKYGLSLPNPYSKPSYGVADISQLGKEITYNAIKTNLLPAIVGFIPHILHLAIPVLKQIFSKRLETSPDPESDPITCLCTREYMPVCGSDSKTYSNYCNLNCKKNKNDPSLYMIKKGECNSNLDFASDNSENYDDEVSENEEDDL